MMAAMTNLLAARALFGLSLAFHIVFAAVGVAMPMLMVLAEWRWRRTGAPVYLELARRWAKGVAILFAVGAVSGTVLSFELGLLWPRFMAFAGPIIGMPFSLEGFAFFSEAIFLGLFLYGRDRISPRLHLFCGVMVAISGVLSASFITLANVWMNHPAGFELVEGRAVGVDPIKAMFPLGWLEQVVHVILSSFAATGLAVSGIHAFFLRRAPRDAFHRAALGIALPVAAVASLLQPISGDFSARRIAFTQPVKLAAMEGHFVTQRGVPLHIGGLPNADTGVTRFSVEIPSGLSLLAFHDARAEVKGLDDFPRSVWPDPLRVHLAFQVMVALGTAMAALAALAGFLRWRRRSLPTDRWFLGVLIAAGPIGFLALEAGWLVTEWGRQPFVIWGVMRTEAAVTPVSNVWVSLVAFGALYLFLGVMVGVLLWRQILHAAPGTREAEEASR